MYTSLAWVELKSNNLQSWQWYHCLRVIPCNPQITRLATKSQRIAIFNQGVIWRCKAMSVMAFVASRAYPLTNANTQYTGPGV